MKLAEVIVAQLERIAVAVETLVRIAEDIKLPDHSRSEEAPGSMDPDLCFPIASCRWKNLKRNTFFTFSVNRTETEHMPPNDWESASEHCATNSTN